MIVFWCLDEEPREAERAEVEDFCVTYGSETVRMKNGRELPSLGWSTGITAYPVGMVAPPLAEGGPYVDVDHEVPGKAPLCWYRMTGDDRLWFLERVRDLLPDAILVEEGTHSL